VGKHILPLAQKSQLLGFIRLGMTQTTTQRSQLYSLITVFFFWGFIAASNGIFIPFCKSYFNLSQFQSQLIDLTFYGGYFIGSLTLFLFSRISKVELLNKIGYKKGITYGLLLSAAGALCIIPSVQLGSYALILSSYFLVALGFSIQQTCAQPYVIALGSPDSGATRLNLAGGINSFGTTIAPIVVSYILFGSIGGDATAASLSSITGLYIGVAILFVLMALFFNFSSLPNITNDTVFEEGIGAFKYPQLVWGMVAIFMYVGVEVSIQSNMGALLRLPEFGGYTESQISPFISLYWGSLMIGRWGNGIGVFNLKGYTKILMQILIPYLAFAVVLVSNMIHGKDVSGSIIYAFPIALMIAVSFLSREKQSRALLYFSLFGFTAMAIGLMTTGKIAVLAFISGGLACSVLWPCIFSVAISGLGKYTSQGSSFLIMMILGGAIIPPLQGLLSDLPSVGIHMSYILTLICFAYLAFYAVKVKSFLKAQGIDEDNIPAENH
jgi:FHS family L-fucose permease-like MFS transporter